MSQTFLFFKDFTGLKGLGLHLFTTSKGGLSETGSQANLSLSLSWDWVELSWVEAELGNNHQTIWYSFLLLIILYGVFYFWWSDTFWLHTFCFTGWQKDRHYGTSKAKECFSSIGRFWKIILVQILSNFKILNYIFRSK